MTDRFEYYDVLGHLIPGLLLVCLIAVLFPDSARLMVATHFPDAFLVIAFLAVAVLLGQVTQAIASLLEPALEWTWGGRPADRALRNGLGDRYLPASGASRIRALLAQGAGGNADERTLFLKAKYHARQAGGGLEARFNALYAYWRALFVLALLSLALYVMSRAWGAAADWPHGLRVAGLWTCIAFVLLTWYRAKQRAMYYVREVLYLAKAAIHDQTATGDVVVKDQTMRGDLDV